MRSRNLHRLAQAAQAVALLSAAMAGGAACAHLADADQRLSLKHVALVSAWEGAAVDGEAREPRERA